MTSVSSQNHPNNIVPFTASDFQNVFESMDIGFASCQMLYDDNGKPIDFLFLYVNGAFTKQSGLPVKRVIGHTVKEVIPEIESFWIETYGRVVKNGKSEQFESEVFSLGLQFEVRVWSSGKGCFAVMFEDIDKRKKKEAVVESKAKELENLSKSQEETNNAMLNVMEDLEVAKATIEIEKAKDEAMLASIGEGLIAVDNDRKIITINKAAISMLGWGMKNMVGSTLISFPSEDESGYLIPMARRPISIALKSGRSTNSTALYLRKDKTRLPVAITVTPIKLAEKITGAIIIFRDVTREREVDKAKSEFVSLASHQLRTPLGIIKWYLEALENESYFTKSPAVMRNYFDEIYKSNERVLSLVRDLLSVSRIEQGRIKNTPVSVDPSSVIRQVVEQMQILARKKKITLFLTFKNKKSTLINIDILRFHEVIENLISNAIQYTKAFGSVHISVERVDGRLLITVKDTGIGISEKNQKMLFTKFFRSEEAVEHNPEGAGLGLYVVKSYVEGWGGKIRVVSAEGKGSTFTIRLPISKEKEKKSRANKSHYQYAPANI